MKYVESDVMWYINKYKRDNQVGTETVAQYKTFPSFPGLARSSLAARNSQISYCKQQTCKAWNKANKTFWSLKKTLYPTCVKIFEAVHIAIVNQLWGTFKTSGQSG